MAILKKLSLLLASVFLFHYGAAAEEDKDYPQVVKSSLSVKLRAATNFQAGYRNQNHLGPTEKNVSYHKDNFAFFSAAAVFFDISNQLDDVKYGAKIVLVPTTSIAGAASLNGTHIYIETNFGIFQAGSPISPATSMMLCEGEIDAGSGAWTRYANFAPSYLKQTSNIEPSFATGSDYFLDNKLSTYVPDKPYSNEPARSIAYYTPKFDSGHGGKLQIGLSYIPDSSNTGAGKASSQSSGVSTIKVEAGSIDRFEIDGTVKDAVAGGVCLEQNLSDGVDLKLSLTGEYGKSAGKAKRFTLADDKTPNASFKLKDLRTYNIGAVLNFGNFSYAGSFGSLGKSLTTPEFHKTNRKTNYYSAAIAYKQDSFATSLSYFYSKTFGNTLSAITIGTSYKLAPGFKPYADVTLFKLKGKPEFSPELSKRATSGAVAIIGAKLSL